MKSGAKLAIFLLSSVGDTYKNANFASRKPRAVMKKLFLLFLAAIAVGACKRDKAVQNVAPVSAPQAADSVLAVPPDTVQSGDTTAVAPPPTVDELFADFIYSYTTNRRFQLERTDFPVREYVDGRLRGSVEKSRWRFDRLYYKHSLHIIILDSERKVRRLLSVRPDTVRVEWLLFGKKRCRQYLFVRERGLWRMNRINIFPISRHADAEFLEFYDRFASDSVFQSQHLAETIDFTTYDEDNHFQKIEGLIEKDQWPAFHPDLPADDIFNIDYGMGLGNRNVRVISVRGNSNSMSSIFKFVRKRNGWTLVKFEN